MVATKRVASGQRPPSTRNRLTDREPAEGMARRLRYDVDCTYFYDMERTRSFSQLPLYHEHNIEAA